MRGAGLSASAVDNSQLASAPLVHHSLRGNALLRPRSPWSGHFKRVAARPLGVASNLVDTDCPLVGIKAKRNSVAPAGRKTGGIAAAAAAATAIIPLTCALPAVEVIDYGQRAADLEKVFNDDAFGAGFAFPTLERLVADLECQPRLDTATRIQSCEPSSSHAVPAGATAKRRGRQPKKLQVQEAQLPGSAPLFSDGKPGVCTTPLSGKSAVQGGGKRRLDLSSRIALRKGKEDQLAAAHHGSVEGKVKRKDNLPNRTRATNIQESTWDVDDIWASQADSLITRYGASMDLGAVNWGNLDKLILSRPEEISLACLMKPMKALQRLRRTLDEQVERRLVHWEATTDQRLAVAANVDLATLRRQLELGRAARNKLIQHNLRLVLHQAHKYYRDRISLSLHDLCQEGVQGLLQGVDKFDPRKGYRFSTYAIYWIRNSILRAQTRSGHLLRSPFNLAGHKFNIRRARFELMLDLGRPATDAEVAAKVGLGQDRFRDIVRSNMRTRSLHERSRVTGEEHIENFPDLECMESKLWRSPGDASLRLGMDDVLDSLKPKESIVIRQRFGLDGKGERSLGEIGRNLNLSREMVRRYEARGLLKLKHPTRVNYLRSYLSV